MSNSEIRSRAWDIYKVSLVPLLVIHIFSSVSDMIRNQNDSIVIAVVILLISLVVNICGYYMMIRGWIEGRMEMAHLLIPFKSSVYRRKILPIMLMELLITIVAGAPMIALLIKGINDPVSLYMNGAIFILSLILLAVVAVAISLVWYIYILEPELKVTEMYRRSAVYMAHHWLGHFIFRLGIMIVPLIATALLQEIIGENVTTLLMTPVEAYISIASVGYVYESILMAEKNKEAAQQSGYTEPVAVTGQTEPAEELPPMQETIEEITERLTEEAKKDIELQLPVVDAENTDNEEI